MNKQLLTEAAKTIRDAEKEGIALIDYMSEDKYRNLVLYKINGAPDIEVNNGSVQLANASIIAMISLMKPRTPSWNALEVYCVAADKGWGPLIYDLALSLHGPIMPYRKGEVSSNAQRIWFNYFLNRPDVKRKFLDDIENPQTKRKIDDSDVIPPKYNKNNPLNYVYYLRDTLDVSSLFLQNKKYREEFSKNFEEKVNLKSIPSNMSFDQEIFEVIIEEMANQKFDLCYAAVPKTEKAPPKETSWIEKHMKQLREFIEEEITNTFNEQKTPGRISYSYSENLINFLKKVEGFSDKPYQKKGDRPTIGYGTTYYIDPKTNKPIPVTLKDKPITQEQGDKILREFLDNITMPSLNNYLKNKPITQNQIDALVSVMYNMGNKGFLDTELFTVASKNPNDPRIKNLFLSEKIATIKGVVSPGLQDRRRKEFELYSGPEGIDIAKEKSIAPLKPKPNTTPVKQTTKKDMSIVDRIKDIF